MKTFFCTLLFSLSCIVVHAQDSTRDKITRPSLFLHFSTLGFNSVNSNSNNSFSDQYAGIGGSYMQGLAKQLDLAISLYGFRVYYPFRTRLDYRSKNTLYELDASLRLKLLPNRHFINPFVMAGVGAYYYVDTYGSFVPLGGGLNFNFHDKFHAALSYQYRFPINEQTEKHYMYTLSIGIPVTKKKSQRLSTTTLTSPTTPKVTTVSSNRVIIKDTAVAKSNTVSTPVLPPQKTVVADTVKTASAISNSSATNTNDTDKDGVPDNEDACPTIAGVASNKGCPDVTNNLIIGKQVASYRVYFFTDQTALPEAATGILQTVLSTLKGNAKLKVQINGNADNIEFEGQSLSNSLQRAQSVANFFLNKGINAKRIMALGLGDTNPKTTNETLMGRSENRRVEISIVRD